MTGFSSLVQQFFQDRLKGQLGASPHTVAAYRDTIKTLIRYTCHQTGKQPADLDLADLDAARVGGFLTWLETEQGNTVATRNARLTAIKSLYRWASYHLPDQGHLIAQVLAIPPKRGPSPVMTYLTFDECEALIAAPDTATRTGRRDQALLHLAIHTGLRVEMASCFGPTPALCFGPTLAGDAAPCWGWVVRASFLGRVLVCRRRPGVAGSGVSLACGLRGSLRLRLG